MDVAPNDASLATVLVACGRLGVVRAGRAVHGWYAKRERELSLTVRNAVLDMYVKCEELDLAGWGFDRIPVKAIVSWTVMISGLVQCKRPNEALEVFNAMQTPGVKPDRVLLSTVFSACASLGSLESGRTPFKNVSSWNAMINGFALHSHGRQAVECFDRMIASAFPPNEELESSDSGVYVLSNLYAVNDRWTKCLDKISGDSIMTG
ncbi:Pentatricopeptide repeat-containing protein [Dichanthelium oligosanthes]|uniref:Pentatricopeptide repeat-containing protein n=1 Tax=Dichanthelium oligosanthes TaxID=888268 RepID=A0A1E5W0J2_9POAL|nr:Pentatricopeptide repeat-containing protein [Dichanthelium oligosanthes]